MTSSAVAAGEVFATLGDPTRRAIVELLVARGQSTATELAAQLKISRQAVTKHLYRLNDTGLTVSRRTGRENRYAVDTEPLGAVTEWITTIERQWSSRLGLLQSSLDRD